MAGGIHHHHHPQSIGISALENLRDLVPNSNAGSSHRASGDWPESAGSSSSSSSSSSSVSGGFNPARMASRVARFSAKASTDGTRSVRSGPSVRALNGDETRSQLINMVAEMQEEIGALRRELHDAADGHLDPAARREKEQAQLQKRRDRMERKRFKNEMRQLDRDERRMQRQQEHADFKLAYELQKQDQEEASMENKMQYEQRKQEQNKVMQGLQLATNAEQLGMQLTRQL